VPSINAKGETDTQVRLTHLAVVLKSWNAALARTHGSPLLEALPAEHRPPLRRTKRNSRFLSALRAIRLGFRAHLRTAPASPTTTFGAFRFAAFATLGFVFEAFVGEKHLLAGGKYKLSATLRALQDLIVVFHEPLSP
jgi:hypothetical protein